MKTFFCDYSIIPKHSENHSWVNHCQWHSLAPFFFLVCEKGLYITVSYYAPWVSGWWPNSEMCFQTLNYFTFLSYKIQFNGVVWLVFYMFITIFYLTPPFVYPHHSCLNPILIIGHVFKNELLTVSPKVSLNRATNHRYFYALRASPITPSVPE